MQDPFVNKNQSNNPVGQITSLMSKISQYTQTMSQTFQQTILKHQQQFIKSYRIKIYELSKLFHQLKKNIEDKFINNAITRQLQSIMQQRDYFKYECLKLNSQYTNLSDDYKNINQQMVNLNQQMSIYKHLLQTQKIKFKQVQLSTSKLKTSFNQLALNSLSKAPTVQPKSPNQYRNYSSKKFDIGRNKLTNDEKENQTVGLLRKEVRDKAEAVRELRGRLGEYEARDRYKQEQEQEKREIYQVFRWCVDSWRREITNKAKKKSARFSVTKLHTITQGIPLSHCTAEQFSALQKKQLLRQLFTHPQFLVFIQKLLFDPKFSVTFADVAQTQTDQKQEILVRNRQKLYQLLKKKGFASSTINKTINFR